MSQQCREANISHTQGQCALVDDEDYTCLRDYRWHAQWAQCTQSYYAMNANKELMHRIIMGPDENEEVDHVNHDTLDNRRKNLRVVTRRKNGENRRDQSAYGPGVWKAKNRKTNPFRAEAKVDGKRVHIGCFATAEEAQAARADFLKA